MSIMHYIAANKKLPLGEFRNKMIQDQAKAIKAIRFENVEIEEGSIPLEQIIELPNMSEEEIQVFGSYEEAAGIYISAVEPGYIDLKNHFSSRFVYSVSPDFGNFYLSKELKNTHPQKFKENRTVFVNLLNMLSKTLMKMRK